MWMNFVLFERCVLLYAHFCRNKHSYGETNDWHSYICTQKATTREIKSLKALLPINYARPEWTLNRYCKSWCITLLLLYDTTTNLFCIFLVVTAWKWKQKGRTWGKHGTNIIFAVCFHMFKVLLQRIVWVQTRHCIIPCLHVHPNAPAYYSSSV